MNLLHEVFEDVRKGGSIKEPRIRGVDRRNLEEIAETLEISITR
jgi:hypothetical protein